ncbi:condensation domain-containing protein [Plantactinospora solaniradicis]|uniref:Condensation domain-containing protein n=1 Tax=Plantactinospora solaniradicis TaxID=1723736 RepID=A0ABW1KI03_9ACTN
MATFLTSTFGTHGDVLPFIRIGQALRARGHEVVLHTHEYYGSTVRAAGLEFVPVDTESGYARTLLEARRLLLNVLADVDHLADYYRRNGLWEQVRREYESMAAVVRERDPAQVVTVSRHTSGLSVLMLREAYGVPAAWVALAPTQLMAMPLTERLFPRTLAASANQVRAAVGMPPVEDWAPWLSSADLELGLWPDWFDGAGDRAPARTALPGFVLHDDAETGELPAEVAELVADDVPPARRPVLLTGGSGQLLHHEWYRLAAEACARAGRPGILVCRHRDLVPDVLPEGVQWQPSLPFRTLIPKVAAVVHHGGVLTSARAIASGVPQVVLAHGVDRPDNAVRLRRLGLGEWLPAARWTTETIAALLRRVLDDPGYAARNRARSPLVDSGAAVEAACDRLEGLLGTTPQPVAGTRTREYTVRDRIAQLSPEQRALLVKRLRPVPRPPRSAGEEVYDCSYHQRRSWLTAQVDTDGASAHVATVIRLRGPLDTEALAAAVAEVVARHDGLRTVPVTGGEEPRQRVVGGLSAPLRVETSVGFESSAVGGSRTSGPDSDGPARWVERLRAEPFDLVRGPLVRAALLRVGPDEHLFLLAGHHFVLDAASLGIVSAEVAAAYGTRVGATGPALEAHPVQYPDVATYQRRRLAGGGLERTLAYWRSALDGVGPPVALPLPAPVAHAQGVAEAVRMLSPEFVDRLTASAGVSGRLTLAPVLLTSYQLLLGRYTGRTDVPVGVFVGGRTEPGTERVVGDFTNIVVVRADLAGEPPFPAAVRRVTDAFAGALTHQDAPFEAVVAALAPPRVAGGPPLVRFGFNMQDYRLHEIAWAGLSATVLPVPAGHSYLDLTLIVLPTDTGQIKVVFEYPADRFAADAVDALATAFHELLRLLAAEPDRPVTEAVRAGVPEPVRPPASTAPLPVEYVPPRTEGEELVAGVVGDVLGLDKVGVHHDFFALGGHSLHAMRVVGRINAATGLDVPVRVVFAHPTVAGLTEALEELAR